MSKKLRVIFMGTPEFAVPSLQTLLLSHEVTLVVTRPDERSGRGRKLRSPPIAILARENNIPVLQPRKIRNDEFYQTIQSHHPDVIVVVAYGKILPKNILEIPPLGCVNVHASLLPKYRGAAPIQWAITHGEKETGVTIMKMDEGMDTGPILQKETLEIGQEDNGETLTPKLAALGAKVLEKALPLYATGQIVPVAQPEEGISLAPILQKKDGLINWSESAKTIVDLVRGMRPWPMAHTYLSDGSFLRILGAKETEGKGDTGTVLVSKPKAKDLALIVAAGKNAVALTEVQLEGKKVQAGNIFAMGHKLSVGDQVGNS